MKHPLLKTTTNAARIDAVRALWAAGYRRAGALDLEEAIDDILNWDNGDMYLYVEDGKHIIRYQEGDVQYTTSFCFIVNSLPQMLRRLAVLKAQP